MGIDNKKLIIVSLISLILFAILICILTLDIPLIGILPIKEVFSKRDEVLQKENQLLTEQNLYKGLSLNLETSENNYKKEKAKYESISEETINIIKEANTEENYSLEYMWIKLGNYAKKNNLTLVMVEPGNTGTDKSSKEQDSSVVDTSELKSSSNSSVLQIELTGNYIDLSDFIFEVENDTELKFKLDNISMEYVSGTTIKTTFDVKNIIITK